MDKVCLLHTRIISASLHALTPIVIDGHEFSEQVHHKNQLISELFRGDVGKIQLDLSIRDGSTELQLQMENYRDRENLLQKMLRRFPNAKISVYLHYTFGQCWVDPRTILGIYEGMRIDPESFVCTGNSLTNRGFFRRMHRNQRADVEVKIVAEIDFAHDAEVASSSQPIGSNCSPVPGNAISSSDNQAKNNYNGSPFSRKIFEEGVRSDVTIIAKNGVGIKSHACFLSACSPVLKAEFHDWTLESEARQVEMKEFSEAGVRAFLHFIYFGDLEEPRRRIDMAFELLKLAEKYDVGILKEEMIANFMERGDEMIKVELAFQIYMFTRNIESAAALRAKAFGILKANSRELKELMEFKEILIEIPEVSLEIFGDFMNSS